MLERGLLSPLRESLRYAPAVLLAGARQTGKSTLALALRGPERGYVTFDEDAQRAAASADPGGFIAGLRGNVTLDEVQKVPGIFPALKLAIDRDRKPGRFLLTGSANVLLLPRLSESLAGRMDILTLGPLTQGEIDGRPESTIDAWFKDGPGRAAPISRADLVARVLRGGFPVPALQRPGEARAVWYSSWLATLLARDIRDLADIDRRVDLRRLAALTAARSAAIVNFTELASTFGMPQTSLKRYMALFETLYLVRFVPAWATGVAKALARRSKLLFADPGLMAHILSLDKERLQASPELFGPLLETFVGAELDRQTAWSRTKPFLLHFRDHEGNEVDWVLEDGSGRVVGVEVKAGTAAPGANDFRGLHALAAAAKKKFLRGILLYGGDKVVPFGANLHAVPIAGLWSPR